MSTELKVIRKEKVETVNEIKQKFEDSRMIIVSDYRGLTVTAINQLRSQLTKEGAHAKVYKNTLARIALNDLSISYPKEMFQGPSIVINTNDDAAKVSKTVVKFAKETDSLVIKGGFLLSSHLDQAGIKELATLPSREELIAMTVGLIKGPLTALVRNISSPLIGLTNVLNAIKKKKEEVS